MRVAESGPELLGEREMGSCRFILIVVCALLPTLVSAQQAPQSDIQTLNYKLVPAWPKTLPGDKSLASGAWNYWQVSSVAVAANGNILVLHRGDHPILEYRPDGEFIGPWGDVTFSEGKVAAISKADRTASMSGYQATYGFGGCSNCGAHEIRVDPEGNVWVVDAPGQVIMKLNPQGHILMTLGTRGKAGMTPNTFYLPTDVAFAPNGEIVVSDGYGNARVMRFSHDGKYLGQFGERGNGPGQFQLPHNVAIDRQGRIYVADRDNQRVEVFDATGKYLTEWDHVGSLSSLVMTRDQHIWAGGVLRDLDGKAMGRLPGEGANARAHGAALAPNGEIYFGLLSGVVEKFIPQ
jgi:DNA-binding beta-propeller fold protein YncE